MKSEKVNSKCINCDEKSETSQGKEESYVPTPPSFAGSFKKGHSKHIEEILRKEYKPKKATEYKKLKDIVF